jgi:transcriptional regulator with XRE-family HTH domain
MNFSEKLKTLRRQFKFSQEALAEKINVSRQAITKWETGEGLPDIENLMTLTELFSVSMDELLMTEKSLQRAKDYSYESITELDISGERHFDIHACGAMETVVSVSDTEKLRVRLASNVLKNVSGDFKVQIDEHRNRMDVDIHRVGGVREEEAKEALVLYITLPAGYCTETELAINTDLLRLQGLGFPFELDGKAAKVSLESVSGKVVLNSSIDMDISCDKLPAALEINQISAVSKVHIPRDEAFFTKIKGKSNHIHYAVNGRSTEPFDTQDAECCIELAGMNAELLIDACATFPWSGEIK